MYYRAGGRDCCPPLVLPGRLGCPAAAERSDAEGEHQEERKVCAVAAALCLKKGYVLSRGKVAEFKGEQDSGTD